MRRILSIVLTIAFIFNMHYFVYADESAETPVLKVGICADFKPFEYYDESGKLTGFDIELMDCIGKKIGYEIEYIDIPFDSLFYAILSGRIDCAVSAITVTEERKRDVDFSEIYLETYEQIDEKTSQVVKYALIFPVDSSEKEKLIEASGDKTFVLPYTLVNNAMKKLKNDGTIEKLMEKYEIPKVNYGGADPSVGISGFSGVAENNRLAEKAFTFDELTGISQKNIEKISIACSRDGRTEFTVSSPMFISDVINGIKKMKFKDDTREGSAGGWLYFVNFYADDGTYIQFGARIHIDNADYLAIDGSAVTEKLAYYYELIKSIDSSEWAKDYILDCRELDILNDKSDIKYKEPISREKFCDLVYNYYKLYADELEVVNAGNPFLDTENQNVMVLNALGIINGISKTEFAPDDLLTREEAAVILSRLINTAHPDLFAHELHHGFDDSGEMSDWAFDSIQRICNMGIMNGVGENCFAPQETYTAEQAVATLVRVYNFKDSQIGFRVVDKNGNIVLNDNDLISCKAVKGDISVGEEEEWYLEIQISDEGRRKFKEATERVAEYPSGENYLVIMVDGLKISRPSVVKTIDSNSILITGDFTEEAAKDLANTIKN